MRAKEGKWQSITGLSITVSLCVSLSPLLSSQKICVCVWQHHTLVLTASGQLYSWGRGREGQCGHGLPFTVSPKYIPDFQNKRVVKISCGETFSSALLDDGTLFAWGSGLWKQQHNKPRQNKPKQQQNQKQQAEPGACEARHRKAKQSQPKQN